MVSTTTSASSRAVELFVKLGLSADVTGYWLLPQLIGRAAANELLLTGDIVDASTAEQLGLVSRVVPPDALMTEAMALAERIAANPGPALRMAKRLLREGQHTRLDTLLEMSAAMQALAHHTPEHGSAIDAFLAAMKR